MSDDTTRRTELLRDLVEYRRDPGPVLRELAEFPWDSEQPLVTVTGEDVRRVLGGFTSGELSAAEVENWANAFEVRDDVRCKSDAVRDAVHYLANPVLEGPLTGSAVARLQESVIERFPCACCGYRTLPEPSPSDEICQVCFWQDDFVDNQDREVRGPNRVSLSQAPANFARLGASAERFVDLVRKPTPDEGPPTPWTESGSDRRA